jgi:hypothetical protein
VKGEQKQENETKRVELGQAIALEELTVLEELNSVVQLAECIVGFFLDRIERVVHRRKSPGRDCQHRKQNGFQHSATQDSEKVKQI